MNRLKSCPLCGAGINANYTVTRFPMLLAPVSDDAGRVCWFEPLDEGHIVDSSGYTYWCDNGHGENEILDALNRGES